jgi:glycosyltransferase involved in cell wall biosynthesis
MPDRISALIVARDEAENLPGCLASLAWADETVVVVDAASRDETEILARRLADRVIVRAFDDFAHQRNAALAMATGDWVFAVDADERATEALAAEIRRTLAESSIEHAGYRIPIRSIVLGRSFGYAGTQHDRPLRLFRRGLGRWVGTVHETVDLRGLAGEMRGHLTHRTIPDIKTFLRKIDHYTTLEAVQFHRQGRPFRTIDLTIRPAWIFLKLYLGKQGFRDGLEGLAFCAMSGLSAAVRHWKLRELILEEGASTASSPLPLGEVPGVRVAAPPATFQSANSETHWRVDGPHPYPLPKGEGARTPSRPRHAGPSSPAGRAT